MKSKLELLSVLKFENDIFKAGDIVTFKVKDDPTEYIAELYDLGHCSFVAYNDKEIEFNFRYDEIEKMELKSNFGDTIESENDEDKDFDFNDLEKEEEKSTMLEEMLKHNWETETDKNSTYEEVEEDYNDMLNEFEAINDSMYPNGRDYDAENNDD